MTRNHVLSPFKQPDHSHRECLERALSRAEHACLERGLRLTRLRRRVLELVWGSHEPVKAYEMLDDLRHEHRSAAPPTVYRALEFLQAQGLVHRIESLNAYVGCGAPGHPSTGQFLICSTCGAVAEMDDGEIVDLISHKAGKLGFAIDRQTIEVKGRCAGCRSEPR